MFALNHPLALDAHPGADTHATPGERTQPNVAARLGCGSAVEWSMADFEPQPHAPRGGASPDAAAATAADAFPGSTPRRVPRSAIETWEGRLEFWDADTEIAWVAEPTTPYHEWPSRRLAALIDRIAAERGSAIACYGSMDLTQRDEHGAPRRILQADESVYVYPPRARRSPAPTRPTS